MSRLRGPRPRGGRSLQQGREKDPQSGRRTLPGRAPTRSGGGSRGRTPRAEPHLARGPLGGGGASWGAPRQGRGLTPPPPARLPGGAGSHLAGSQEGAGSHLAEAPGRGGGRSLIPAPLGLAGGSGVLPHRERQGPDPALSPGRGPSRRLPLGAGAAVAFAFTLFSRSLRDLPFCS